MADIEWTHIWQFRVQSLSWPPIRSILRSAHLDKAHDHKQASLFIKIYMEGVPIGRKLNLFAQDGYDSLITTIAHMFPTTILCKYTNFKLYSFSFFWKEIQFFSVTLYPKMEPYGYATFKFYLLFEIGPGADRVHSDKYHVLTYEDKEGDWMMVGDVPWE